MSKRELFMQAYVAWSKASQDTDSPFKLVQALWDDYCKARDAYLRNAHSNFYVVPAIVSRDEEFAN